MKRISGFLLALTLLTGCSSTDLSYKDNVIVATEAYTAEPTAVTPSEGSTFEIDYIDVGQADCALIQCDGANMLIDGGNAADSNLVIAFLKKRNISEINYMLCTHGHEDHVGGLSGPLSVMTVDNAYAPEAAGTSKAYNNFIKKAEANGLTIQHPKTGDVINVGSSIVEFYVPTYSYVDNLNNTSIMCMVTYGENRFLFTGDAEYDEEKNILSQGINLDADVLKVGHHGSSTSTNYEFLRSVMPQYGIISVGYGNSYGHPTDACLSRLRDADVSVYRTDLQGDITLKSNGKTISISTQKNETIQTNTTDKVAEGYIGNTRSKKFHKPTCRSLPEEHNRVHFSNRSDAITAGYESCRLCYP